LLREAGILPNDPALLGLTDIHKAWIVSNVNAEAEEMEKIGRPGGSTRTQVGEVTTVRENIGDYGVSDEEFEEFNRLNREALERQRKEQGNAGSR
jgi:hypothetical protein